VSLRRRGARVEPERAPCREPAVRPGRGTPSHRRGYRWSQHPGSV